MTENLLARENSPYLLQHKDNPVHWRPWGDAALAEARASGKPILLSVGYAACHWCHVMAHESFEDPATAGLMNEHFVNIKVDREERPDIDTIYQAALAMMGEQGGWPLTMFLTPDAEPFWGGTYFPPAPRYGRPSFPQVLDHIAKLYREDPAAIEKNVTALRQGLAQLSQPKPGDGLSMPFLDEVVGAAFRLIDPIRGGTAGAPKFPQPVFFRFLWRGFLRTRRSLLRDAVTQTLDALCQGGIYDHLGGGFARYSTDVDWLVPHFEKMLYDNALLIDLLTEVWQESRRALYAVRVRETIDWLMTEMAIDPGDGTMAFAAALDADSEGEEGRYYVWDESEIDATLGDDASLFKRTYNVKGGGNWEGRCILHRDRCPDLLSEADERALAHSNSRLLAVRCQRLPPGRDDKVLADWNGLAIAALASAGAVFGRADWLDTARSVLRFVITHMRRADGRLYHSWRAGLARHPATIEDYANLARAALILYETAGDRPCLDLAEEWVAIANRHYWDGNHGGYFLSADDTADVITRTKPIAENATPSGNGTMLEVLGRLYHHTGAADYRARAERMALVFSGTSSQYLIGICGLLTAFEVLARPVQVAILGDVDDPATNALVRAALCQSSPPKIITRLADNEPLPSHHPATGKTRLSGRPTAYVCLGDSCGLPVTGPEALAAQLAKL